MTAQTTNYSISAIPAFNDNYLWLLDDAQSAIVVDPGDATPVLKALQAKNLHLAAIVITHHHADHIGGVDALLRQFPVPVIGPDDQRIPQRTQTVADGDVVSLLDLTAEVIAVPGHTLHHISYYIPLPNPLGSPILFAGDTLFAGGCGRVFEGTFVQMRQSLARLKALPPATRIYCAHEYTEANLNFALAVEPNNHTLQQRVEQVVQQRARGEATVPSTLEDELATNPFLRYDQPAVIQAAGNRSAQSADADSVFAAIREWKDHF